MLDLVLEREHELIVSAALGMFFSIGIIYFLHKYPGKPFDYVNDRYVDNVSLKKKDDDAPDIQDTNLDTAQYNTQNGEVTELNTYMKTLNEDDVVKSTRKMQNVFGISEDNVRYAVRQTKEDILNGGSLNDDDRFTYSQILDFLVIASLVCVIVYFIDVEAHGIHGDFSKVLQALFPLEFDTLGVGGGGTRGAQSDKQSQ